MIFRFTSFVFIFICLFLIIIFIVISTLFEDISLVLFHFVPNTPVELSCLILRLREGLQHVLFEGEGPVVQQLKHLFEFGTVYQFELWHGVEFVFLNDGIQLLMVANQSARLLRDDEFVSTGADHDVEHIEVASSDSIL